ncbi:MAG: DUF3794 domain-containing protein [Halanaerobiales bacterium]
MLQIHDVEELELIKVPVVIGENVTQRMEVTDLKLNMPAIKVRDINARIQNIQSEVVDDRVIIQADIYKQIFYVGTDDIIHYQSANVQFSTFIDVPGAEPGMELVIEPSIEHTIGKLSADGTMLHEKILIQFFVKVLSVQQLMIEVGSGPLVKVERVVGENTVEKMIRSNLTLAVEASKIVDIITEVKGLETEVVNDKVIIQGLVHNQLFYIGEDDVEHLKGEDIPFTEFLDLPGVETGMNVQLYPAVENIRQDLSTDRLNITQEVLMELFVKVTEKVQINVVTGDDSMVMLPEVIGENVKQITDETTMKLEQKALNVREISASLEDLNVVVINDKVIIHGNIHKTAFYIGKDNIEYHQAEIIPYNTFVNVIGAKPGMNVEITPTITFSQPVLSGEGGFLTQKVIGDIFIKVTDDIQFRVSEVGPYEAYNIKPDFTKS